MYWPWVGDESSMWSAHASPALSTLLTYPPRHTPYLVVVDEVEIL